MSETLAAITEMAVGLVTAALGVMVWRSRRPVTMVFGTLLVLAGAVAVANAVVTLLGR